MVFTTTSFVAVLSLAMIAGAAAHSATTCHAPGHQEDGPLPGVSLFQKAATLDTSYRTVTSAATTLSEANGLLLLAAVVATLALYTLWRDFGPKPSAAAKKPQEPDEIIDVIIVGGGFGGAYSAYQINQEFPDKKVCLFEKSDRIGGRLMSVRNDAAHGELSLVKQELGGMRIFPSKMGKVAEMVKAAGCHLVPVSLNDDHNLFYYKGERYEKGTFKMSSGRTCGQMSDACTKKWLQAHPEDKGRDCYESPELRSLSLSEFFQKYGATPEEIDAHNCFGGYDLATDNVTASLYVKDGELYGAALSKDQKYVHEGYNTVVEQLVVKSQARVHMKRKVTSVTKDIASGLIHVTASSRNGTSKVHRAKQVLISLPFDQMTELTETLDVSPSRQLALKNVVMLPLFKCFLEWEEDKVWWKALGYACGKSTTDLDLRQVHYYDSVDLLVYNSGPFALKWNYRFQQDPGKAARLAFEMLKELHNMPDMPEPLWDRTHYKFWVDGSHKWRVGADIPEDMKTICHGQQDGSNIYLCGDAVSGYQGWVCGAVETADLCLNEMRKKLRAKAPSKLSRMGSAVIMEGSVDETLQGLRD